MGIRVLLGLVLTLTVGCSAGGGGGSDELEYLPDVVFGGGRGNLSLHVEVNQPAVLRASFSQYDEETDTEGEGLYAQVDVEPGSRDFNVQVPDHTYLYFELGVPEATVGATVDWTISLNGTRIWREHDQLENALAPGYAFFLQIEASDLRELMEWADY